MSSSQAVLHATFAPQDTPGLFAIAAEAGYDGVEAEAPRGPSRGADPVKWPSASEMREALIAVQELRRRTGVRTDTVTAGGFWCLLDKDHPDRVAGEVAFFSGLLPLLAELCEARVVTVNLAGPLVAPGAAYRELDRNGSAIATGVHVQRAADALRRIGDVAQRCGMKIGVEMHGCSIADCAAATRKLMDLAAHPAVGVTWDVGNVFTMGRAEPWEQHLKLFGPHIVNVHLKNAAYGAWKWKRSPLGAGAIQDFPAQIRALLATGYQGAFAVEAPGLREKQLETARMDLAFLKDVLKD